jgi:tetratricopeptide (TPR) repeat protein
MNRSLRFIDKLLIAVTIFFCLIFCLINPIANASALVRGEVDAREAMKLGVQKLQMSDYSGAIGRFTQAIEINPEYSAAYSNRCLAFLNLQEYQSAVSDCNQAINLAANNVEAYINRGIAYYRQNNYADAIADENRAIGLKPHDFRAYYNRGVAIAAATLEKSIASDATPLERYQDAISDYHRALSLIPATSSYLLADIYNDIGLAQFHLNNIESATDNFTLAIHLNPQDSRAFFNRGCTCGKNGDNLGAIRDFSNTVQLNPSNSQAYVNRGIAHHRLGYEQAAISDLQTAATQFGQQGEQIAYERTIDLIKAVQRQISAIAQIA